MFLFEIFLVLGVFKSVDIVFVRKGPLVKLIKNMSSTTVLYYSVIIHPWKLDGSFHYSME